MEIKPIEVAFLEYLDGLERCNNLPSYWKYTYGIDSEYQANKYIKMGLIEYKVDIYNNLNKLKLSELKELLKINDLKQTGKKQELVERLLGNVDIDELQSLVPQKRFYLTESGKKLINKYFLFVINIKKHYCLSDEVMFNVHTIYNNETDINKLLIYALNMELDNCFNENKYSMYRVRTYQLAEIYLKSDQYEQALKYFIACFKLDLYGFEDNYLKRLENISFSPANIQYLKNAITLSHNENNLLFYVKNDTISDIVPFKYFSDEICYQILLDVISGRSINLCKYKHNTAPEEYFSYNYNLYKDDYIVKNSSSKGLFNFVKRIFTKD